MLEQEIKMDLVQLESEINAAWDNRETVNAETKGAVRGAVVEALGKRRGDDDTERVPEPTFRLG